MFESAEDLEIVYYSKPTYGYIIPDGGYGWWTVFAAFMNSALIDGMFFSFGMIRPLLEEYLPPMEKASFAINWIGALQISAPMISGPIASILGNKFGFRPVAMTGGLISACCYLICFFSPPNIWVFYIFYGIIGGFGLGFVYMAGIITISQYFDKKRPLSTGIAVCGTGVGIFIMGSIIQHIVDYYTWHGMIIILAGFSFQTIIFSCILRPLPQVEITEEPQSNEILKPDAFRLKDSMILSREAIDSVIKSGFISSYIDLTIMRESMVTTPVENHEILFIRSLSNVTSIPINRMTSTDGKQSLSERLSHFKYFFIKPVCFRNRQLFLYFLSALFFSLCYTLPFYYITSRVISIFSYSEVNAGLIVSAMGISSSLSRLATGVAATFAPNQKLWIYVVVLLLCGTVNIVSSAFNNYALWIFWGVVAGGTLGSVKTLESVMLAEMVKLEEMASTFGSYQLTLGLGFLMGPPLAGIIFDLFENYDLIFYILGILFILSGIVVVPIYWIIGSK